jgi:hypothetical protein
MYADTYGSFHERITNLERISPDAIKKRVADALELAPKYMKGCQRKLLAEQLLVIRRQLSQFEGLGFDGFRSPDQSVPFSESEEATLQEVVQFLELSAEKVCAQYADKALLDSILSQITAAVAISSSRLQKNISTLREQAPRAKTIAQAWEKRRDDLSKSIENQSAPVNIVADQLGWIIGVFCVFGILMFVSVNVFKETVQIELVASGQVIQFATVMVLLIVVCVLGMSKLLGENVLGTLLGGIGGYVLSQGVGRAATRAATRDSPPAPPPSGG